MVTATLVQTETLGTRTRKLRLALRITQQELSIRSGVSRETISLFEHNLPVILDSRRRILKELWAIKASRLEN
jgi:transcriptional regulator with XRE-family HTH domain